MSNWTPEAREYLDGYLAQVRALVRQSGEDAEETASELRDHIEQEAAAAAGELVTLDHVRAVLATVGSPEQVASADSFLARANGVHPAPTAARNTPVSAPAVPATRSRFGCCLAAALCVPLALVAAVLVPLISFQYASFQKSIVYGSQKSAIASLNDIYEAEKASILRDAADIDGDGIPDYAGWEQLTVGDEPPGSYEQIRGNYRFQLHTMPSASNAAKPTFTCEATPMLDELPNAYAIDETGNLRTIPVHGGELDPVADTQRRERAGIEITNQLRTLADSERRFLEYDRTDKDGDGVPDYSSILELRRTLSDIDTEDYVISIVTRDSASNGGKPGFTCTATPRSTLPGAPVYVIDETGNVSMHSDATVPDPIEKAADPVAIQVPVLHKQEEQPQTQVVPPTDPPVLH